MSTTMSFILTVHVSFTSKLILGQLATVVKKGHVLQMLIAISHICFEFVHVAVKEYI